MPPGHRPRTAFPDIRGPPQKKQTAAQMDTASLSSSYGIISKIFANRFVPESECKSTDFYNNCQILNTLFSKEKDDDMASMVHNLFSNSIFRSIKKNHEREGRKRLPMSGKAWKATGASATQRKELPPRRQERPPLWENSPMLSALWISSRQPNPRLELFERCRRRRSSHGR